MYTCNEHVGYIEQSIRVVKQCARATCADLPFKRMPKLMIVELIAGVNWALNMFSTCVGMKNAVSPAMIVEGRSKPDLNVKRICFGQYAQIYLETQGNLNQRSVPGIALRPCNKNGGHYFFNLETGKRMHSYNWVDLPILEWAIRRVEYYAKKDKQRFIEQGELCFSWSPDGDDFNNEFEENFLISDDISEQQQDPPIQHFPSLDSDEDDSDFSPETTKSDSDLSYNSSSSSSQSSSEIKEQDDMNDATSDLHDQQSNIDTDSNSGTNQDDNDIQDANEAQKSYLQRL